MGRKEPTPNPLGGQKPPPPAVPPKRRAALEQELADSRAAVQALSERLERQALRSEHLRIVADQIDTWDREGADEDVPEGARFVRVGDAVARSLSHFLRGLADA